MTAGLEAIQQARAAARDGAWANALKLFETLDPRSLEPSDLEIVADSQWWLCRLEEAMATRQSAYQAFVASGDEPRAAYNAWFLAYDHFSKNEGTLGAGWLARAQRHLAHHPDCIEHAYLAIADAHALEGEGRWEDACDCTRRAVTLGERFGSHDVTVLALQTLGRELIALGNVREGLRLLDEAMTSVISGELSEFHTGWVYCNVLIACIELGEVGRAVDWSDAATTWCDSLSTTTPYNGLCRVYRVSVLSLRGAFAEAEEAARHARAELGAFVPSAAAAAWYEIGEIRRRLGDLEGAEEGFTRSLELGGEAHPGLALIRLGQGRSDAAQAGLRTALANREANRLARTRLLAAQVEVGLARGDTRSAREATDELRALASDYGSSFIQAHADTAEGQMRLATEDAIGALDVLHKARRAWQALKLPYETAMTRVLIAKAAGVTGDQERAELELRAATRSLEELGVDASIQIGTTAMLDRNLLPGGLSRREAQVLAEVARGRTNRQIAAELTISEHTVARHVSNIFAKLGINSRAAAAAYATEKGLVESGADTQN